MTVKQKLEVELSKSRTALNAAAADDSIEQDKLDGMMDAHTALEKRYQVACMAGDEAPDGDAIENADDSTAEGRELRSIVKRASLGSYMSAAYTQSMLQGAESELNAALNIGDIDGTAVPWHMLEEGSEVEKRADVVTPGPDTTGARQSGILGRVFANTAAAWLGVTMPQVPVGKEVYSTLTTGASAAAIAKDGAQDAGAGAFTSVSKSPTRIQARFLFRLEDAAVLRGMEESLRADLRGALSEELDRQVIAGNGTGANLSGFLSGLTAAEDVTAVSAAANYLGAVTGAVDGRYAQGLEDVRMLVGSTVNAHMYSLVFTNTAANVRSYLRNEGAALRVSAHIPAASSNKQDAIVATNPSMGAVAPLWPAISIIRDPHTKASEGQVALTAVALASFVIRQPGGYSLVKFKVA